MATEDDKESSTDPSVITDDARLIARGGSVITAADQSMMSRKGPFVQLDGNALEVLAKAAAATYKYFQELAQGIMTDERARFVRELRADHTWRAVAQRCHDEWKGCWEPPSNQLMGMALCEAAAERLGEDPGEEPWN